MLLDYGVDNVAVAAVSVCGNQVHYSVSFLFRLIKLFSTFVNNLRLQCHFIATVAGQGFGLRSMYMDVNCSCVTVYVSVFSYRFFVVVVVESFFFSRFPYIVRIQLKFSTIDGHYETVKKHTIHNILRIKSSAYKMTNNQNKVIQIQFAGSTFCFFFWIFFFFWFGLL